MTSRINMGVIPPTAPDYTLNQWHNRPMNNAAAQAKLRADPTRLADARESDRRVRISRVEKAHRHAIIEVDHRLGAQAEADRLTTIIEAERRAGMTHRIAVLDQRGTMKKAAEASATVWEPRALEHASAVTAITLVDEAVAAANPTFIMYRSVSDYPR